MAHHLNDARTSANERNILQFLYDEGPHTSQDVAEVVGLSKDHVMKTLLSMEDQGLVEKDRLIKGSSRIFWIYQYGIEEQRATA